MPGSLPTFQMWVERFEDGSWKKVGCAFRTELGIYTAKHVPAGKDFRLTTATAVVEVPYDQVRELDADVIVIPECYSPSAVSRAKLARGALFGADSMQVEITNGVQRSVGPLVASKSFGSVIYSGSTIGGFSGAPYYSGRNILGMHTGAAAVNYGYEAGFLAIMTVRKEDSQDVLLDFLKRGAKFSWKTSPFDPDEVFIRTGRGYDTVESQKFWEVMEEIGAQEADHDAMEAVFGDGEGYRAFRPSLSRSQRKTYASGRKKFSMEDGFIFPDSGNLNQPAAVVYPSAGEPQCNLPAANPENPQTSQETPSKSLPDSPKKATEHQTRKHVRKSEVSVSTLKNMLQEASEMPPVEAMEMLKTMVSLTQSLQARLSVRLSEQ